MGFPTRFHPGDVVYLISDRDHQPGVIAGILFYSNKDYCYVVERNGEND